MNKKNSSGTGMFMMEMIAAVFFFILCASICILVFVKADGMSRLARDMNRSVAAAESVAEVWKAEGMEGLSVRCEAAGDADKVYIYWDGNWNPVTETEKPRFFGEMIRTADGPMEKAEISVTRLEDGKELFSMTEARYLPGNG